MSKKSAQIAAMIESCQGGRHDAHYLGYFRCFNSALYYEAHDVLEELWLADKAGPAGNFYKGLIQLAGAFVHMQKHTKARPRLQPAAALLRLARKNLSPYPSLFHDLSVTEVIALIERWMGELEKGRFEINPLGVCPAPNLRLSDE